MKNSKIYSEMFKEWLRVTGIKEGDTVIFKKAWTQGEQGYNAEYKEHWNKYIGSIMEVRGAEEVGEFLVLNGVNAPYFVLEPIESVKEVTISNRTVKFTDDGVTCGCCNLTKTNAKKAVKAFEELSKLFIEYSFSINIDGSNISRDNINEMKKFLD